MAATLTNPSLPEGYSLVSGYPPIPQYRHLREASGLSPKTEAQASKVATGSWYGCYVTYTGEDSQATAVAMGRIVGDGGWYFHIADMATLPEHQRKGLGDVVMKRLLWEIKENAAEGKPYVTLLADPPGRKLYQNNGFVDSSDESLGMKLKGGWNEVIGREFL